MRDLDHPFVRDLAPADARAVLGNTRRRAFERGSTVFSAGDDADGFYLILAGRVASRATSADGDLNTFAILGPGDSFGEMALLGDGARRSSTIVALEPTSLLLIPAASFAALRKAVPAINDALLDVLAQRIRRLSDHLIEALHVPVEQRIVRRLIVLCRAYSAELDESVTVPVSQADLAALAGSSRQTVNKRLRAMQADGVLRLARSSITVAQPRRLSAYAR